MAKMSISLSENVQQLIINKNSLKFQILILTNKKYNDIIRATKTAYVQENDCCCPKMAVIGRLLPNFFQKGKKICRLLNKVT